VIDGSQECRCLSLSGQPLLHGGQRYQPVPDKIRGRHSIQIIRKAISLRIPGRVWRIVGSVHHSPAACASPPFGLIELRPPCFRPGNGLSRLFT
jgi:hypothetical protein